MKELLKRLKLAEKQGCEFISIKQVIQWIYDIQRENRLKNFNRKKQLNKIIQK